VSDLTGSTPATLASGRGIQSVDPDAVIMLEVPHTALDAADAGGVASNADPTGARFFALQWNMRAVQADAAWAHGILGSSNVSIFMLDSGIDYLHADLLGRVDLTRSIDLLGTFLGFPKAGHGRFVGLLQKVFNFARGKGVTIVVSAGNEAANLNRNGNVYETFCDTPAVICVSATGPTADATGLTSATGPWTNIDAPAFYSNFGSAIDVAAPGGNESAGPPLPPPAFRGAFVWAGCSQTIYPPLAARLGLSVCATSPRFIIGAEGTSMAAPHVTGTAALLVSTLGRNPARIKARIEQTADHIDTNGQSLFYGHGRVNVARAVVSSPEAVG